MNWKVWGGAFPMLSPSGWSGWTRPPVPTDRRPWSSPSLRCVSWLPLHNVSICAILWYLLCQMVPFQYSKDILQFLKKLLQSLVIHLNSSVSQNILRTFPNHHFLTPRLSLGSPPALCLTHWGSVPLQTILITMSLWRNVLWLVNYWKKSLLLNNGTSGSPWVHIINLYNNIWTLTK